MKQPVQNFIFKMDIEEKNPEYMTEPKIRNQEHKISSSKQYKILANKPVNLKKGNNLLSEELQSS